MKKYDDDVPRAYTDEEVSEIFISQIWHLIDYWHNESKAEGKEKLEGLAHSFLVMLDGNSWLPKFIVAPDPHPTDKNYHIKNNEHYFPENYLTDIDCNISGGLHHLLYKYENKQS